MNKKTVYLFSLKLLLLVLLAVPQIVSAQYFYNSSDGDMDLGFRKTGGHTEPFETVVYLGNISDFVKLTSGTTTNIANYNHQDLTNMCYDNLGNLQWSVSSALQDNFTTSVGVFPAETCFYTLLRTNSIITAKSLTRLSYNNDSDLQNKIQSLAQGATSISQALGSTNVYNNTQVVLESTTSPDQVIYNNLLTVFIGDRTTSSFGDFGGQEISYTVENTTSNSFTSPSVSDFFAVVPQSSSGDGTFIDPVTGLANGLMSRLGFFTFNTNGIMTYTAAFSFASPVTNGSVPLKIVFNTTATNTAGVTNWVWNFGNGTSITNTTGVNATNTYAATGTYSVTLTLNGTNGSFVYYLPSYIVASASSTPIPKFTKEVLSSGKLILNGTNGTASAQFRILLSTNLALTNWPPVYTNNFLGDGSFSYTNSSPTNRASFYRLISP